MKEVKQIEALHDCSGASMHELASLIQHMREGPEKEQLRDLIEADIERYVHVPLEAKARCVRDYVKREQAAANMKVCAACGLRDPTESYESRNLRDLNLCADHWLHAGAGAFARLRATRPMQLYRAGVAADTAPDVVVRRELLCNLSAFDGRDFHLVPEAVRPDGGVDLCGRCRRAFNAQETAKRRAMPRGVGEAGGDGTMVTLGAAPEAVNVVVGGTRDAPRLWHEVPLDDLSGLLPSVYTCRCWSRPTARRPSASRCTLRSRASRRRSG